MGLSSDPLLLPRALTEPEVQAEQIHMHAISNTTPRFPFYVSTGFWMLLGSILASKSHPKIDEILIDFFNDFS